MNELTSLLIQEKETEKSEFKDKGMKIPISRLFDEDVILSLYKLGYGITNLDFKMNHGISGIRRVIEVLDKDDTEITDIVLITKKKNVTF